MSKFQATYHCEEDDEKKEIHMKALYDAPKYKRFLQKITKNFVQRNGTKSLLDIHHIAFFGPPKPEKLGFVYLTANVALPSEPDKMVPGITFIRGDSVAIMVILKVENESDKLVLVQQARVPVGKVGCVELLAGMKDGDKPALLTATDEMLQEAGMFIYPKELIDLTPNGALDVSPGGCDEQMFLYAVEKKFTAKEYANFKKKEKIIFGLEEEHEKIHIVIIPFSDWKKVPDMKLWAAVAAYTTR
jgi:hypothetical protein